MKETKKIKKKKREKVAKGEVLCLCGRAAS
jgi:hypothetical protein